MFRVSNVVHTSLDSVCDCAYRFGGVDRTGESYSRLRDRTREERGVRPRREEGPSRYQGSPPTSPVTRWRVRVPDGKVSPRVPRSFFDRLVPSIVLGLAERCCWRLLDGYGAI